jgi:hypothetical protein
MSALTVSHPRLRLTVETRRDDREARIPRLIIRAPGDTGVWQFRACVSRVRSAVEDMSASVVSGAPWDIRERQCWDRGSGVCVALELRTFGGSDKEADTGLRLLERLADEFAARQVAA